MEAIQRTLFSNDWITLTFLIGFVFLFLMKLYKPQRLLGYSIAFFTQGFIEKRAEENPSIFTPFNTLLFLFGVTTVSLAIYLTASNDVLVPSFLNFLLIIVGVTLYFLLFYFINYSISKILNIDEQVRYFLYTKSGYLYNFCLWLFPLLIVYQYGFKNKNFLFSFIAILVVFRFFLILRNNKKLVFNQLFYFILYFCTLELAPLLILYKITTI